MNFEMPSSKADCCNFFLNSFISGCEFRLHGESSPIVPGSLCGNVFSQHKGINLKSLESSSWVNTEGKHRKFTGLYSLRKFWCYRSGTVNSKSFVGKVLLRIKRKFELTYAL